MAGSTLAAGLLATAAALSLGLAMVGGAAVTAQRAAGAADAAALAAADAASGAVPSAEQPCALADRVARASGATVRACTIQGFVATVEVQAAYAGLAAVSRARAGPPEGNGRPARTSLTVNAPTQWCVWCASKKGRPLG